MLSDDKMDVSTTLVAAADKMDLQVYTIALFTAALLLFHCCLLLQIPLSHLASFLFSAPLSLIVVSLSCSRPFFVSHFLSRALFLVHALAHPASLSRHFSELLSPPPLCVNARYMTLARER